MLYYLGKEEYKDIIRVLAWVSDRISCRHSEIDELILGAVSHIIIEADANAVPYAILRHTLVSVIEAHARHVYDAGPSWFNSAVSYAENMRALRNLVRDIKENDAADIEIELQQFLAAMDTTLTEIAVAHFQEDVFPVFIVNADHLFDAQQAH
jgi:cytochrome c551/c552